MAMGSFARSMMMTAAVTLLAVGCGGSDHIEPISEPTRTRVTEIPGADPAAPNPGSGDDRGADADAGDGSDPVELDARLLTLGDLPSGWSDAGIGFDVGDGDNFCDVEGASYEPNPDEEALAAFKSDETETVLVHTVGQFASQKRAQGGLDALRSAIEHCPEISEERDGVVLTLQASPVPSPTIGDDSVAYRMVGQFDDPSAFQMTADAVVVRRGNRIAEVMTLVFEGSNDPNFLKELAQTAHERLR